MIIHKQVIAAFVLLCCSVLAIAQNDSFAVGDTVMVQSEDGFLILYSDASENSDVVEAVVNGIELLVVDDPQTVNDVIWLSVESPSGTSGWIPTMINGQSTLASLQSTSENASNSNLAVGAEAVISTETFITVHAEADADSAILEALVNGLVVTVVGGPLEVDGQTWRQIESPSTITGWIQEQADGQPVIFPEGFAPVPEPTPTIIPTQTSVGDPIASFDEEVLVINFTAPEVWVRASPSTEDPNWTVIPSGSIARIVSRESTIAQDMHWYQIETIFNSVTGWVEEELIVTYEVTISSELERSCPGARNYGFVASQRFFVPFGDGPTSVWSEPNSQPLITRISEGGSGTIIDGPVCKDGQQGKLLTWYIETDNGQRGWVASGYSTSPIPWIVPIPNEQELNALSTTTSVNQELPIVALPVVDRQRAVRIYPTIWSLTDYRDLTQPGTANYNITVDANTTYRFAFTWCASSVQEFPEILSPLSVRIYIDGVRLLENDLSRSTLDGVCEIWETLLSGWKVGQTVTLEIRYSLSQAILNGQYAAGDYIQSISATAQ